MNVDSGANARHPRPTRLAVVALLLAWTALGSRAYAGPPPEDPRDRQETFAISVRHEFRRDRFRYRFENPSSFNTTAAVPHFFAQSYRADSHWLLAGARYPLFGLIAATEFGLTPERLTIGDDYDTFFEPNGNVAVYGTTADVSLRSYRLSQRLERRSNAGWSARVGYTYQRDRSLFHPSPTTTTETSPPSSSSFWNTARETTVSDVHEIEVGLAREIRAAREWTIVARADVAPLRVARLTTILPDKYPGQDIVFVSRGLSVAPAIAAEWRHGRWSAHLVAGYSTTLNYRRSDQFHRCTAAVGAGLERALR